MIDIFWDSSALVKLYHLEDGSEKTASIFTDPQFRHFASVISKVEIRHALIKRFRSNELKEEQLKNALLRLMWDSSRKIHFVALNDAIINEAGKLVLDYTIKSMDALILACLWELRHSPQEMIFTSADKKQINLAKQLDFKTLYPSDEF